MAQDLFGLVGSTVAGKYAIEAPVGEGGFSIVYRGAHQLLGQRVAVKVLKIPPHFDEAARSVFIERFCNEGRILSNLADHPSIVRVLDFGTTGVGGQSLFYLVLEWLEGRDLETIFLERRAAFSERDAIVLLSPAIEALALAHTQGIAHRDLKPANLYLAETKLGPRLKVLDFGIAKAIQEGEQAARLTTHTSSGFRAFTPPYGAPEQFRPKKHGPTGTWTDVHALGLILVELVAGQPALVGEEEADFLLQSTSSERPSPRRRGATVSDGFEALCLRALALEPRERYQDAKELLAALAPFGADGPQPESELAAAPRTGATVVVPLKKWLATEVMAVNSAVGSPNLALPAPSFLLRAAEKTANATPPGVSGPIPEASRDSPPSPAGHRRLVWLVGGTTVLAVAGTLATVRMLSSRDSGLEKASVPPPSAASSRPATPPPPSAPATSTAVAPTPPPSLALSEMSTIPKGTFEMGSNGGDADERPVHAVTVKSFEVDTTEVTVERYEKCYHAGPCTAPDTGPSCNWGHADRKHHPVNCVDAEQARAFCGWDKKRLPTEEELEYAAIGTDDRMYPWGNDEPTDERLCWGRRDGTCPVGTHPKGASFFGVHDLAGNVSEWTLSAYCDSYARRRNCTTGRVFRGASFIELRPEAVRSAFRDEKDPKQRTPYVGFRCARPR